MTQTSSDGQNLNNLTLESESEVLKMFIGLPATHQSRGGMMLYVLEAQSCCTYAGLRQMLKSYIEVSDFVCKAGEDQQACLADLGTALMRGGNVLLYLQSAPEEALVAELQSIQGQRRFTDSGPMAGAELLPTARLLVFATRDLIEEQISYPRFYELFDFVRTV